MSDTQGAARDGSGTGPTVAGHHITGRHAGEIEAADDRGRRWYQLRPEPRRASDLLGFSRTWWMVAAWLILILVLAYPFAWW